MAAVRPSAGLGEGLGPWSWNLAVTELQQGLSSAVLPATSLLPGSTLRPALPACPYHQPPDIPAGGWDAGQGRKRKKTKETKPGEGGPCVTSWTTLLSHPSFSLPFLPSSFTPFLPPSFSFSSPTFHPLPSWACAFGQSA